MSSSSSSTSSVANRKGPRRRPDLTLPIPQRDSTLVVPLPLSPTSNSVPPTSHNPNQTQRPRQLINFSELERHNRIGSGSGGTVYKVVHRAMSRVFALKVINGNHENSVRSQIRRQIEILRDVDHPNVVKCHDMYDHNGEIEVLLEFMDSGSLEGCHIAEEHVLAELARQVLSGLAYLHRRHIVHRDIRPSNLLINSRKNVKIAVFGVSRILAQTMDPCNSSAGAIAYMSPERINTDLNNRKYDGYAGDIWSFGVSILEFSLGRFPFSVGRQGDWASLMCAICFSEPPEALASASMEFRDFIACCLHRDPHRRWTAAQLLQHPFILRGGRGQSQVNQNLPQKVVGLWGLRHAAEATDESEDVDILKVFRRQKMYAAVDEPVAQVLSIVDSPEAHQQYGQLLEINQQAKVRGDESIGWNDEKQVSPWEIDCSLSLPSKIHSSPGLEEHRTSQPDISIPNSDAGYEIDNVLRAARTRWLKPEEVLFILQNHEKFWLSQTPPLKPLSGALFLFNRKVLPYFRKDGYNWHKRKDGKTVMETYERLMVGNVEALICYCSYGEQNLSFQRRCYWMLDPASGHIVLVHYREITKKMPSHGSVARLPGVWPSAAYFDQNSVFSELCESYQNLSSPSSAEDTSEITSKGTEVDRKGEFTSSELEFPQALFKLMKQLSLNDGVFEETDSLSSQELEYKSKICKQDQYGALLVQEEYKGGHPGFQGHSDNLVLHQDAGTQQTNSDCTTFSDQDCIGVPHEADLRLTVAQRQKFAIHEIFPNWGYANEATKVIIVGSFLYDPSESTWSCMFGDTEVPLQIIQEGVICCEAPPHHPGKVSLCITSGNGESCSEVKEFDYRLKTSSYTHDNLSQKEATSFDELCLLIRFLQMLLVDSSVKKREEVESEYHQLQRMKANYDLWGPVIDVFSVGSSSSSDTVDRLLQIPLKDKLQQWLSSKSMGESDQPVCSLSKKEQGIIHMVAGLGFEWALNPILRQGVSINFRDINGWTALHWAAHFGREKMVAALLASGASAGAMTDPNVQDPLGKTPASIAASGGHKGLAGYLSEIALTSHCSSLTLDESEISECSAEVEAEITVNSVSNPSLSTSEDHLSLKDTLAVVSNADLAAAGIQSASHGHYFRKRLQIEAAAGDASIDEYDINADDTPELSAIPKQALQVSALSIYNLAALSIQTKYREWKCRKDYLTIHQKVVKIQAHVKGYQVRKKYKVLLHMCQKEVGWQSFLHAAESTDESEDVHIPKVFCRQKMYECVTQVLSIVDSPEVYQQYGQWRKINQQAKVREDEGIGWNDEEQVSPGQIVCSLSLPSKIHSSQPDISIPNSDAVRLSLESLTCSEGEVTESFGTAGDVSQPLDIVLQAQALKSPVPFTLFPDTNKTSNIMPGETLEYFEIDSFSSFECLLRSNFTVKQLKISKCPDLVLMLPLMPHISLESLEFNCCSFFSLSFSNFYPPTLKRLKIADCIYSELILKVLMDQKGLCLESLEIEGCSSLVSFPIVKLPATLRQLKIVNCMNLKSLRASSKIGNCGSVIFVPEDDSSIEDMASTNSLELKELDIWDCVELEFLPEGLNNFTYLDMLSISNCPSLECFPEGGLPNTSLKSLLISECENLKSLPRQIHKINSLQILNVSGCPSLTSFPEGGLPPNLVSLQIIDCENLIPVSQWELHKLKLLNKYSIIGGCPDVG